MKLSQAILFMNLLPTSDAMSIRGIVNKSAVVVDKDDLLAKATAVPVEGAADIDNDDEEQHGLLQAEEGGRLLATTIMT